MNLSGYDSREEEKEKETYPAKDRLNNSRVHIDRDGRDLATNDRIFLIVKTRVEDK